MPITIPKGEIFSITNIIDNMSSNHLSKLKNISSSLRVIVGDMDFAKQLSLNEVFFYLLSLNWIMLAINNIPHMIHQHHLSLIFCLEYAKITLFYKKTKLLLSCLCFMLIKVHTKLKESLNFSFNLFVYTGWELEGKRPIELNTHKYQLNRNNLSYIGKNLFLQKEIFQRILSKIGL